MPETTTRYGILVAVDGSDGSDAAVAWAAREAVLRSMPITLVHTVAPVVVGWPVGQLYSDIPNWQNETARQVVAQARKVLDETVGPASVDVRTEVVYDNVVPTLIDASADAWLLVVGSKGLGAIGRMLLGSVSASLVRHAQSPVAVVHAGPGPSPEAPVLLGVDGSPASEAATALAFDEADRRGVQLIALHAWSDVGAFPGLDRDWRDYERQGQEILAERLAGRQEQYPDLVVHRRVVGYQPARWLLKEAERAQLVVVGSRGRGGFPGLLLGSVGATVAQSAGVPVIVVRARG